MKHLNISSPSLFWKVEMERKLSDSFCETSFTLLPKPKTVQKRKPRANFSHEYRLKNIHKALANKI